VIFYQLSIGIERAGQLLVMCRLPVHPGLLFGRASFGKTAAHPVSNLKACFSRNYSIAGTSPVPPHGSNRMLFFAAETRCCAL
jgi:hypothetical protein